MWFTTETRSPLIAPTVQHAFDCLTQVRIKLSANALPGTTIARIVGRWGIDTDTIFTTQIRDYRMGFVVADTTDAGTSVPKTFDDDADFMHVDSLYSKPGDTTPDTKTVEGGPFDIRAMRKMEEIDQTLFFSAHNAGESTDIVYMRARILVLLP